MTQTPAGPWPQPPQRIPPPAHQRPSRGARSSAWWLVIPALVALAGVVWVGIAVGRAVHEFSDGSGFPVVPASTSRSVGLDRAGTWSVFLERYGTSGPNTHGVTVRVTAQDGTDLRVRGAGGSSYTVGARQGQLVAAVEVPEPGTYTVSVEGAQSDELVRILPGGQGSTALSIVIAGLGCVALFMLALGLGVWWFARRGRA